MIERFAVRIYDPSGVIVPHKEFEIQEGISRYFIFIIVFLISVLDAHYSCHDYLHFFVTG